MDENFQKVHVYDVFFRKKFLGLFHKKVHKKDIFEYFDGMNRVFKQQNIQMLRKRTLLSSF